VVAVVATVDNVLVDRCSVLVLLVSLVLLLSG